MTILIRFSFDSHLLHILIIIYIYIVQVLVEEL